METFFPISKFDSSHDKPVASTPARSFGLTPINEASFLTAAERRANRRKILDEKRVNRSQVFIDEKLFPQILEDKKSELKTLISKNVELRKELLMPAFERPRFETPLSIEDEIQFISAEIKMLRQDNAWIHSIYNEIFEQVIYSDLRTL